MSRGWRVVVRFLPSTPPPRHVFGVFLGQGTEVVVDSIPEKGSGHRPRSEERTVVDSS